MHCATIVAVLHDFTKGNAVTFSCHLLLQITTDGINTPSKITDSNSTGYFNQWTNSAHSASLFQHVK